MEYGYAVEGQRGSGQHGAHQRQSIQQASFTYKRHFLIPEVRLPVDPVKVFEIITKPSMFAYYHYSRELEASSNYLLAGIVCDSVSGGHQDFLFRRMRPPFPSRTHASCGKEIIKRPLV